MPQHLVPGSAHTRHQQCGARSPQLQQTFSLPCTVPRRTPHHTHDSDPTTPCELSQTIVHLLTAGMAPSTYKSYRYSWALFSQFASSAYLLQEQLALPLASNILAMFVAYLYQRGYKASSIRSHMTAISYSHCILNLPSPTESFLISKMLKGVSALLPGGDFRLPITPSLLKTLVPIMGSIAPSRYDHHLYYVMFVTAFFAFLRVSEL